MVQALLPGGVEAALALTASWILTYLAHSLLWLVTAWTLDARTRLIRSSRTRSALWATALAGGLITASVQTAVGVGPGLQVDIEESEKLVTEIPGPALVGERPIPGGERPAATASTADDGVGAESMTWRSPHRPTADPRPWLHAVEHDWPFLLALAGLLGGLAGLGRHVLRRRRLQRRLASRTPIRDGPLREALDDLTDSMGGREHVVLSRSPSVPVPVALPGGEICLPVGLLRGLDPEARDAVLAHELAHIERRDPTLLRVLSLLESVLAFQPLNRLARKRIVAASERIADDRVRERGLGPALAEGLVAAAGRVRRGLAAPTVGLVPRSDVGRRVARLLEPTTGKESGSAPWTVPLATGALLALGLAAGPAVGVELVDHPVHGETADGASSAAVVATSETSSLWEAGSADSVARVQIDGTTGAIRLTLRPGREALRLTLPGGRVAEAPVPSGGVGRPPAIRVFHPVPGDYVLHVPPSVDRLALEVDGRFLLGAPGTQGGELPKLVTPPADGG